MEVTSEGPLNDSSILESEQKADDVLTKDLEHSDAASKTVITRESENEIRSCEPEIEILDPKMKSEIDVSIENLKHTLFRNLEQIFRRTSKELLTPSETETRKSDGHCTGAVSERKMSMVGESGSLRELASCYLKERQNILRTVLSAVKPVDSDVNEGQVTSQRQMQIWTEIATDLDGYYLEMLNKFLRVGKITATDIKNGTLLTYRLSETVVDDLNRNRRKEVFSSREDVHDDIIYGQFQEPFVSNDNTVERLIEGLLSRTNESRRHAIGFFDNEVICEKETEATSSKTVDFDESDFGWSEWSEESHGGNEANDSLSLHGVKQLRKKVEDYTSYVEEQRKELDIRKDIIKELREDNVKLLEALETFDEYRMKLGTSQDERMKDVKNDCESKLDEKKCDHEMLQGIVSENGEDVEMSKRSVECRNGLEKLDEKQCAFQVGFSRVYECFDEAYRQLKMLSSTARKDSEIDGNFSNQITGYTVSNSPKFLPEEELKAVRRQINEQENLIAYFIEWVPERLLQLCERSKCVNVSFRNREDKSAEGIIRYLDELFAQLLASANATNDNISKLEGMADLFKRDFHKMKSQYIKTRCSFESAVSTKEDLEVQVMKQDEIIKSQAELLQKHGKELSEARSQNETLCYDLKWAMGSLDTERERSALLEEELNQSKLLEQERSEENDKLLELITDKNLATNMPQSTEDNAAVLDDMCLSCWTKQVPFL